MYFLASLLLLYIFVFKLTNLFRTEASWSGSRPEHHTDDLDSISGALSVAPGLTGSLTAALHDVWLSCCQLKLEIEGPGAGGLTLDGWVAQQWSKLRSGAR